MYDLLRDEYDIQIEFGDLGNILAYISIGDRIQDIERLVGALADIKRLYEREASNLFSAEYLGLWLQLLERRFMRMKHFRLPIRQGESAVSLSCVTRRVFRFWHLVR